jgi:hypothetical protein
VAFSHSLNRVNGTNTAGKKIEMYWRATVCYRKIDGKWMVTQIQTKVASRGYLSFEASLRPVSKNPVIAISCSSNLTSVIMTQTPE